MILVDDHGPALGLELIDTAEAAAILGLKANTLAVWRSRGEGPRYYRIGARIVRYDRTDVHTFAYSGSSGACQ